MRWLVGMLFHSIVTRTSNKGLCCHAGLDLMEVKILRWIFLAYDHITSCDRGSQLKSEQGMYAGEVGVPRLLKMFDKYKIKTTWFIPGLS
jgi:hypothetical protein